MAAINTRGRRRLNHGAGPGKKKYEGNKIFDHLIEQEQKFDHIDRVILPYKPREYLHGLPGTYIGTAGGASKFQKTKYQILKTLMLKEERGETGQGSWQELTKLLPIQGGGVRLSCWRMAAGSSMSVWVAIIIPISGEHRPSGTDCWVKEEDSFEEWK